jgi:signal transduction histidine kinase
MREIRTVFTDSPGGDRRGLVELSAYLTVAVGYLYAVLSASRLTLLPFILFSLLNVAWVGTFWYMSRGPCPANQLGWPLAALGALAVAAQLTAWQGIGLDWLLPVVAAAVLCLCLSWRVALAGSAALYAATVITLGNLGCACSSVATTFSQRLTLAFPGIFTLLPAYAFTMIFAIVMQRQQLLRERAEELAAALANSSADLEEANGRLRRFSEQATELAVTRERNRMAREIHDTLGHYLTILAVKLETATKLEEHQDQRLHAELVEARRVAAECLAEVRRSVAALRPADLSAVSFADALRRLVAEFESTAPEVEVALDLEGPAQELTPELRVTLYRCAQEALTNVRKHARATKVLLRLRVETAAADLAVLDNGQGAPAAENHQSGFGLLGMRERVALLGGAIAAGPEPGRGWRVEVHVPRDGAPDGAWSAGSAVPEAGALASG